MQDFGYINYAHLCCLQEASNQACVIIVGHKCDMNAERKVSTKDGQNVCNKTSGTQGLAVVVTV